MADSDIQFFTDHPDRQARIREPVITLVKDKQRGVRYTPENEGEFWSLGPHDKSRRRVIVWRVPDGPQADLARKRMRLKKNEVPLLKIPFLLYADETVEDRDDVLVPLIDGIMREAVRGR